MVNSVMLEGVILDLDPESRSFLLEAPRSKPLLSGHCLDPFAVKVFNYNTRSLLKVRDPVRVMGRLFYDPPSGALSLYLEALQPL